MAALPSFVQLMASLGLDDSPPPASATPPAPPPRRYAPYLAHNRTPSASSSSSSESSPVCPVRSRKSRRKVAPSDSSSDIAGDTPISTYVRRKTPGSSPVSPNFDSGYESSASLNQPPFSVPSLPVLLANSPSSDLDPTSDSDGHIGEKQDYYRFLLPQRTGTRISAARAARREQIARRYALRN